MSARAPGFEIVDDRATWNGIVLGLDGHLRQAYESGEFEGASGWRPHRYAVRDGDRYAAAISIVSRHLPGVPGSILYASRGPSIEWKNDAAWRGLLAAIADVARRTRAIALRLSPAVRDTDGVAQEMLARHGFVPLADQWSTWNAPRMTMTLDITEGETALRRRVHRRASQYIGRTVKQGGVIETVTSPEGVRRFHALLLALGRRKHVPFRTLASFEALRRHVLAAGHGCLLLARHGSVDMAGLLGAAFGRRGYFLYAAVDTGTDEARALHPGPSLYWEFIRWAKARDCEAIDWAGSGTQDPPCETDPGYGVYRFKSAFGATLERLAPYHDLVFRPRLYRAFRFAERTLLPKAWSLRARLNR
jgi:GNAT acetyltransferase-like protein